MIVKDLIEKLEKMPQDAGVVFEDITREIIYAIGDVAYDDSLRHAVIKYAPDNCHEDEDEVRAS